MMGKDEFVNKQGSKNNANEKNGKAFKRDASQETQIRISINPFAFLMLRGNSQLMIFGRMCFCK